MPAQRSVQRNTPDMLAGIHSTSSVTCITGEISVATAEQSAGIEQINYAITKMDELTQQNATLVEPSNGAVAR